MSDQSPTIGELKREIEDLNARVEELEILAGLEDGETAYYKEEAVHEAVRQHLKNAEEYRRRSTGGPR